MAVLLLGNGINRALSTKSWQSLIYTLSLNIDNPEIREQLVQLHPGSMSLLAEIIISCHDIDEKSALAQIASFFSDESSSLYDKLYKIEDLSHILTTNYDKNIEKAFSKMRQPVFPIINSSVQRETKYNVYRRNNVGNKQIWHIHGVADVPGSIQLGFERYASALSKMIEFRNAQLGCFENSAGADAWESWMEPFLWGNTHIIGLSLTTDEIDIWWTIQYWAKYHEKRGFGSLIYYSSDLNENELAKYRNNLLKGFGVTVVEADPVLLRADAYSTVYADWINNI